MALVKEDVHYWEPLDEVTDYITNKLVKPNDYVVEVGPGFFDAFKRANAFVDLKNESEAKNSFICDVNCEPLPFKDKEVDFIYTRHVVEDLYNPFFFIKEMSRVAKRGYIEVPSPMAEIGRGVDAGARTYRGYFHHRYIGWMYGKELRLIAKLPILEYCKFEEEKIDDLLKQGRYWNTYYYWENEINFKHRQPGIDYEIIPSYPLILNEAMQRSITATDEFFCNLEQAMKS